MSRRPTRKGATPHSQSAARRRLLEIGLVGIARHEFSKVTPSDLAAGFSVVRSRVHRSFGRADERLAAAPATTHGGDLERLRARTMRLDVPAECGAETRRANAP